MIIAVHELKGGRDETEFSLEMTVIVQVRDNEPQMIS